MFLFFIPAENSFSGVHSFLGIYRGFIREKCPEMGSRKSTKNNGGTFLHQFRLITFL